MPTVISKVLECTKEASFYCVLPTEQYREGIHHFENLMLQKFQCLIQFPLINEKGFHGHTFYHYKWKLL